MSDEEYYNQEEGGNDGGDGGDYGGGDYGGDAGGYEEQPEQDNQGYDQGQYDYGQGDYGQPQEEYAEPEPEEEPQEQEEPEYQNYGEADYGDVPEEEEEVADEPAPEEEEEQEYQEDNDEEHDEEHDEDQQDEHEDEEHQDEHEEWDQEELDAEVAEWSPDDVCTPDAMEKLEASGRTMAATSDGDGGCGFNMASMVKGAMDGFGGGGLNGIVGMISSVAGGGGGGGLTNVFSSGGFSSIAERLVSSAAHRFLGVDAATGAIIGAIAGNIIFEMGGKGNSLGGVGKIILDNIVSGKYRKKVDPWVSPVPGAQSFSLDFKTERDKCLQERRLFEDPEFPPADRSLYFKTPPKQHVEWKRPGEIVQDPQLIVEGHSRFDVKQGALGDCWLLAAVANLTLRDELFYRVVPPDQSFTENYAGIFHFQFWRYGKWVDVVIDDKLPTVDGQLIYMHSQEHNEFWSALLEKAYAKLYGSYENLEGGNTVEALEDFTGGLTEFYDLRKTPKETILAMMVRGFQMGALFGCSIGADPSVKEAVCDNGLVRGHAYSITALQTVHTHRGEVALVRIRNPWGNKTEWNGDWSDNSQKWSEVSEEEKQRIDVVFEKDGEFWMAFDDFYKEYEDMEVCNLSAAIMDEISEMTGVDTSSVAKVAHWDEKMDDGVWSSANGTAGGCANYPDSYYRNPQFASYFTVTEESVEGDGKCTVIVAVLQKNRRELRTVGLDSLPIGFSVYEAPGQGMPLDMHYLRNHKAIARVPIFINMREVTVRFRVPPGEFVILPCTYEPGSEGDFLIRVYANGALNMQKVQG